MIDEHFDDSLAERQTHHETGERFTEGGQVLRAHIFCIITCTVLTRIDWCDVARVTINTLPDVALLEIFDFYLVSGLVTQWHALVHVCRKWRNIVFGSPNRLELRLYCEPGTPVRETIDVWPLLPISVDSGDLGCLEKWGVDNIVAALERNDRICDFSLVDSSSSHLGKVAEVMQQPFPALTSLQLALEDGRVLPVVVPDSFLGGSAPRLQVLFLDCIPFPGLPKLLLSATHLVDLELRRIPHSGYISPDAMVTGLSALTRLERLIIAFDSPRCRPDRKRRRPPPQARTLLPYLTQLQFSGADKYLEDLVAQIDAPLLGLLAVSFFHKLIFDAPHWQLAEFISRTPTFKIPDEALVVFSNSRVWVLISQPSDGWLCFEISCRQSDWQLSSLAQFCCSAFFQALIPAIEHLYILEDNFSRPHWQDDIESSQWLELLHLFTAVKGLYISRESIPRIEPALQELIGESALEVLPALKTLFLDGEPPSGSVQESIGQFVAARHRAGHPVAVSRWPDTGKKWSVEMLMVHSLIW